MGWKRPNRNGSQPAHALALALGDPAAHVLLAEVHDGQRQALAMQVDRLLQVPVGHRARPPESLVHLDRPGPARGGPHWLDQKSTIIRYSLVSPLSHHPHPDRQPPGSDSPATGAAARRCTTSGTRPTVRDPRGPLPLAPLVRRTGDHSREVRRSDRSVSRCRREGTRAVGRSNCPSGCWTGPLAAPAGRQARRADRDLGQLRDSASGDRHAPGDVVEIGIPLHPPEEIPMSEPRDPNADPTGPVPSPPTTTRIGSGSRRTCGTRR